MPALLPRPATTGAAPPPRPLRPIGCPSACRWCDGRSRRDTSPRPGFRCVRPRVFGPHGAYCGDGRLGPNRPNVGHPGRPAAMCASRPVSLPMNICASAAAPRRRRSVDRSVRSDRSGGPRGSPASNPARPAAARVRRREDRDPSRRQRPVRRGQPQRQLGETFPPPLLAAPVRRRADRQHRRPRRQRVADSACARICDRPIQPPRRGPRRRIEIEQPGRAGAPVARPEIALAHRSPLAGAQHSHGKRGAAQIDDHDPSGLPGNAADDKARGQCAAKRRFRSTIDRSRSSPAAPPRTAAQQPEPAAIRQPRMRMALDQVCEQAGRQNGVADTRRGYEQNIHIADPISRPRRLAKRAADL